MSVLKGEDWPPEKGQKGAGEKQVGEKQVGQNVAGPVDSQAMPSIIGPDLVVLGDLQSEGPVQIEGRIEGDVDSPSVIVGKDAYIDGSVSAEQVRILGAVAGWVRAAKVSIAETGRVDGCIQHEELVSEVASRGFHPLRLIPASLDERQRWLLVRNLSLAIVLLLLVYFLGNSGRWSFVQDLPDFLVPVLGDQNVVAFLAFGFLVLLGYAAARAQLAAEGSLHRRLVEMERKLALLRRSGGSRPAAAARRPAPAPKTTAPKTPAPKIAAPEASAPQIPAPKALAPEALAPEALAPEALAPEALAKITERLDAMERRLAGLAGDSPAGTLGLPAKAATRSRHRPSPQRGAGS